VNNDLETDFLVGTQSFHGVVADGGSGWMGAVCGEEYAA
jgi:hypothetical protein